MADESQTPFDQGIYLVHLNRGREHFEQRNFADAIQELDQARRLRPTDETILNLLGLAFFKQEKYREADRVYNQLIEFNPGSDVLYFNQGLVCFKLGALDRAEAAFLRALEIVSENPKVNFYLGHIYERKRQYYNAIFQYRKAGANIMVQRVQEKIESARAATKETELKLPPTGTATGDTLPPYRGALAEPKSTDDSPPAPIKLTVDTMDRHRFLTALQQTPVEPPNADSKDKPALLFEDKGSEAPKDKENIPTEPMERFDKVPGEVGPEMRRHSEPPPTPSGEQPEEHRVEMTDDDTVEQPTEQPGEQTPEKEAESTVDDPADKTAPLREAKKTPEQTSELDSVPAGEPDTEPAGGGLEEASPEPTEKPSGPTQGRRTVVELTEPVIPDLSLTELSKGKQPTGAQDNLFASIPPKPAERRRRASDSRELFPFGLPVERETGRSETVSIRRKISFDDEDEHRESSQLYGRMRRRDDIFRYLENNLMEVNFSGKVFIKQGTIYSYSGNLTFWVKPQRKGATTPLVIVSGTGRLLLSDHQREITVMQINGEEVFVEPSHLLACQETLMPRYALIKKEETSKPEIQVLAIKGTGMIALSVATDPLLLTVTDGFPVNVSSANIISWSGELTPTIVDDEALADLMYPRDRPAVNLRLEGSGKVMMEKLTG